jgi:uncharacterized protein YbaR (Trm112 family)
VKPWLLDILACPIDKHFPLQLYIFSYETHIQEFQDFFEIYKARNLESIRLEKIINIIKDPEGLPVKVKDLIVIKETAVEDYLNKILQSINELKNIDDRSQIDIIKMIYSLALNEIQEEIRNFVDKKKYQALENLLPELYLINKLKIDVEIESGLLFCEKCNRWFPIIETIPQMLPDKYRDRKKEIKFLKNKKNLLDKSFFRTELQPFGIE